MCFGVPRVWFWLKSFFYFGPIWACHVTKEPYLLVFQVFTPNDFLYQKSVFHIHDGKSRSVIKEKLLLKIIKFLKYGNIYTLLVIHFCKPFSGTSHAKYVHR